MPTGRAFKGEDEEEEMEDEEREGIDQDMDAMAYIRSRKKVHQLHNARKMDNLV